MLWIFGKKFILIYFKVHKFLYIYLEITWREREKKAMKYWAKGVFITEYFILYFMTSEKCKLKDMSQDWKKFVKIEILKRKKAISKFLTQSFFIINLNSNI